MLDGHNHIRCENGLNQLALDPAMSAHAQFQAQRLVSAGDCNNPFHSPEFDSWYANVHAGENTECIFSTVGCSSDPGKVIDFWMTSPQHRQNILDPKYNWIGTGYACDGHNAYFVVQFRS